MNTILIIDDCKVMQRMIQKTIERYMPFTTVESVSSGREAISQFNVIKPDLIVLDIDMPDQDGVYILQRLKSLHPECGVIMCTSNADKNTVITCIKTGANDFISKPIDITHLLQSIKKFFIEKQERSLNKNEILRC